MHVLPTPFVFHCHHLQFGWMKYVVLQCPIRVWRFNFVSYKHQNHISSIKEKHVNWAPTVSPFSGHSEIMQSIHVRHRLPHFLHFVLGVGSSKSRQFLPTYFYWNLEAPNVNLISEKFVKFIFPIFKAHQ